MRFLLFVLTAFVAGAALIIANPTNKIGELLQKAGLLEGMLERYSVSPGETVAPAEVPPPPSSPEAPPQAAVPAPVTTPAPAPAPPPPPPPQDPLVARLKALIANLERENDGLNEKVQALQAQRAGSNTMSGDAKKLQRDIDDNQKRIADYQGQLEAALARAKASQ